MGVRALQTVVDRSLYPLPKTSFRDLNMDELAEVAAKPDEEKWQTPKWPEFGRG